MKTADESRFVGYNDMKQQSALRSSYHESVWKSESYSCFVQYVVNLRVLHNLRT